MHKLVYLLVAALVLAPAKTLAFTSRISKEGAIRCGVHLRHPGFSEAAVDEKGNILDDSWTGLEVDFCKALAVAVFADPSKVEFLSLQTSDRIPALQSGAIDVLSQTTTWTLKRDTSYGLEFAGIIYYDDQSFLVAEDLGISRSSQLLEAENLSICVQSATTSQENAEDFFGGTESAPSWVPVSSPSESMEYFRDGKCQVITSDRSQLNGIGKDLKKQKVRYVILEDAISSEPLAPAVQEGNGAWLNLTRWTLNALNKAEELGITQGNVDQIVMAFFLRSQGITQTNFGERLEDVTRGLGKQATSHLPPEISKEDLRGFTVDAFNAAGEQFFGVTEAQYLLGLKGQSGKYLGVDRWWAYRIIKHFGNYGECYNRNLGPNSELTMPRGPNRSWKHGGLLFSPPFN